MSRRQQEPKCVPPGKHSNEENKDVGSSRQGRQKSWSSFQHNFGRGGYRREPPHLQDNDGNEGKRDVQEVRQVKDTQNTICEKRMALPSESYVQVTMRRDRKPPEGEVGQITQDGSLERWFNVTVPRAIKYDKIWLMNTIASHCRVPFTPVDFYYVKSQARFFVQGASTASALRDINCKICDEKNKKIHIIVNTSDVPFSVRDKLEPSKMEQLKLTMNKRYDPIKKSLDLQIFRLDPDLVGLDIDIMLNRRNCMAATMQIIKEDFPELFSLNLCDNSLYQLNVLSDIIQVAPTVKILNLSKNQLKSTQELVRIKELKLEELCLEGNPLLDTFPDQSAYISLVVEDVASLAHIGIITAPFRAIRKYFPKLLRLDGQVLPPPITIDIDRPHLTQPCEERDEGYEVPETPVMQFLQKYFFTYDSGDRQGLLAAYHDEACFSLTIPFNPEDPAPSSLSEYSKKNRNMKTLKDHSLRVQLLKYTKRDIVCSLCMLPKTQHYFLSFVVDMSLNTEKMLCFSVNGVFKEVEGVSQGSVRAFSRTFVATPASDSSVCILNDELFVTDATPNEIQSALSIRVPTTTSSSGPSLSQEQQEMVQASSTQSGMSPQCPQK